MTRWRIALGIRAQLLLVLTVFLAIPWLGYEYVRELERFLRDAQEATLAGTAQAVATALHDRPRLFEVRPESLESLATERQSEDTSPPGAALRSPAVAGAAMLSPASPEIEQIIQGLSRTNARIWVIDRGLRVLARAGTLKQGLAQTDAEDSPVPRWWQWLERETLHPLYALALKQPTEDFNDELAGTAVVQGKEVDRALSGILATDRRLTADGKAVIVAAAHPIWVGDQVKGAVIVEETTNAVLAERNRAFERLFNIVLAALLLGSVALTIYAAWLSSRIRRLRDEAESAIDPHGRVLGVLAGSTAGDEIGDLSRSFSSILTRLSEYASYQENMASRLSHELRTPIAVVRSSLDNLKLSELPDQARVYIERAQGGLNRLAHILTRMTEASRLEHSLRDAERERFDLAQVVSGCVAGYRIAYPDRTIELAMPDDELACEGAPELIAQMLDKLVANAAEFGTRGTPIAVRVAREDAMIELAVSNQGPLLPAAMRGRLFDSMVSVRPGQGGDEPHLGLGLYIVRLIAEFHGGGATAADNADASGVDVMVTLASAANATLG